MATIPHTRTRRHALDLLSRPEYDIRASKNEVSKDLQQVCLTSKVQLSLLSGVGQTKAGETGGKGRKRTFSEREAEIMDAVLGLASFITESEFPHKSTIRPPASLPSSKPKAKPAVPIAKPKSKPAPPLPKAPVPPRTSNIQPNYQMPFGYQFSLANYLYPYMDKSQSMMPLMSLPAANLYPYGMMYQPGFYGAPSWPMPVQMPVMMQGNGGGAEQKKIYKRAARHVQIACFIRAEAGKPAEDTTVKYMKYM